MLLKSINEALIIIILLTISEPCYPKNNLLLISLETTNVDSRVLKPDSLSNSIIITRNITIENYFQFLDSLVSKYDSLTPYNLTEHLLVRANPWIINTLQNTDYYRMKERDSFVYDQKKMIVLPKGGSIIIPDFISAEKILKSFKNTTIDINIPEFKLRIYENHEILYEFPIRVGKNEKKYLEMSGRIQDLRTKTGVGKIVKHIRIPRYVNPVNNHEYFVTKRDDDQVTKLPQIPFLETELNGQRYGQLIHPTTNPITLGKPASNGCIGTKEADAWVIYYYTPINTKITIRYDLTISDGNGGNIILEDIYKYYNLNN